MIMREKKIFARGIDIQIEIKLEGMELQPPLHTRQAYFSKHKTVL